MVFGLSAIAGTVTFDFKQNTYGIEGQTAGVNTNTEYFNNATITNGDVKIVFSGTGSNAWRFWTDGLRQYRSAGASFTVSTTNGQNITAVTWNSASGVNLSLDSSPDDVLDNGWYGDQASVSFVTTKSTTNNGIASLTVTFGEAAEQPTIPEWTVSEALAQMAAGYEGDAIVTGIISGIDDIDTGTYGNATYYIKDSLNDEASLEVYRGYGLNGEKFTSNDQLAVGAKVQVSGKLTNYNGTFEFTSGSKILNYTAPSDTPDNPDTPDETIWSVAQALNQLEGGFTGDAMVKGYVISITELSTSFGNATYVIADQTNSTEGLLVYRGYGLDGEKFTSEDQLEVGALVVVSGTLVDYNGTFEFTTGSKITSYKAPENGGGSTDNPDAPTWSATEALNQISMGFQGNAYVEGYIISVKEVSTEYGNATYTIANNMSYTEGLSVFRGKYIDGAPFTAKNQIAKGGKVKVYGYLTIYDNTAEIVASKIITYEAPEGGGDDTPDNPGEEGGVEKVIFSESFSESLGGFTTAGDLPEGLTYVWNWGGSNYGAKASAYVGGNRYNVSAWLVSPEINLAGYKDVTLSFENALNYLSGNKATDFVGVYVGAAGSIPSESAWNNLSNEVTFASGSDWTFVESGEVPVPESFNGQKVQIGFLYISTTEVAPTWEIKNLNVKGTTTGAGVDSINVDNKAPIEYYNLQGVRIANPEKGGLYIMRQGNKATKVLVR